MKIKLFIAVFLLAAAIAPAQTNSLTGLLQQGLFEEQASRNLDAAIIDYQALALRFDQDRQIAATAVFRLGECYRAQGRTNEAAAQYQRILHDFSDQQTLALLSRQNLAGMGAVEAPARTPDRANTPDAAPVSAEAAVLDGQLAGIAMLFDPEQKARATLVLFPDETLKKMLLRLPRLKEQASQIKTNSQLSLGDFTGSKTYAVAISPKTKLARPETHGTNLLADAEGELSLQQKWIAGRVDSILELQRTKLRAMQAAARPAPAHGETAVPAAVSDEDREIQRVQQMIQNSPDLINATAAREGSTPLVKAAFNGRLKVAAYLLDHGADVNATTPDFRWASVLADSGYGPVTPLMAAVIAGNKAMTQFLIDRGAEVNFNKLKSEDTPLHLATKENFQAVVAVLLASHAEVNARNHAGASPLFAAVQNGNVKIIQMLLAAGADANVKNSDGQTVLNFSIQSSPELFQMLLAGGANPNTEDSQGRTPLSYAAEQGMTNIVKLLLAAKAGPNRGTLDAPLLGAIQKRDLTAAELLLQAGANPNAKGKVGWSVFMNGSLCDGSWHKSVTPLYFAATQDQLPMVQLLLKSKADPNNTETDGHPLLFSVLDHSEIIHALLEAGADPNVADERGDSALHSAASALADEPVFAALLDHKANPNVRNHAGKTPLALLKDALQDHSSRPSRLNSYVEKEALITKLIARLHEHGALDNLPDWDRITFSRPADDYSRTVFEKNTNNWNHFSLLEMLYVSGVNIDYPHTKFPDLAHLTVARPAQDGLTRQRIPVNLLAGTNGLDFTHDLPLEFGDIVEVPEREHSLADSVTVLSKDQAMAILNHFHDQAGEATLVVAGGATVKLPLQPFYSQLTSVLSRNNTARAALTSNSDLARVKVTRQNPQTNKQEEWIVDCSHGDSPVSLSDLWLRAGDVIEVPAKP
ncbi:MAG: ankyrin repeat domain-containing protein [Verrucomicrobiae bacterium]|nr:ankyrin repeat domain-containing protein [Verrucomicrobiae bacterium]